MVAEDGASLSRRRRLMTQGCRDSKVEIATIGEGEGGDVLCLKKIKK